MDFILRCYLQIRAWIVQQICSEFGISAYIQARNFGNKELIITKKGKTFHPNYVEITDPRVLERIANLRTESERQFSNDKWRYRRDRMSNRGVSEVELYMLITMITTLLTAITAFCVGISNLIRSSSAFKWLTKEGQSQIFMGNKILITVYRQNGVRKKSTLNPQIIVYPHR